MFTAGRGRSKKRGERGAIGGEKRGGLSGRILMRKRESLLLSLTTGAETRKDRKRRAIS